MAGDQKAHRLPLLACDAGGGEIFLQVREELVPGLGEAGVVGAGAHIEIAGPLHIFAGAPDHHGGQPGGIGELFSGEDVGRRAAHLLRRGVVVIGLDAGEAQAGQGRLNAGINAAQIGRAAEGHGG